MDEGVGIPNIGFDFSTPDDRCFAFDYDHSGKLDHLVLYRAGGGLCAIVKNDGAGQLAVVSIHAGGIGGYDLLDKADQAIAFDFEHSGKLDHIFFYRPGGRQFWMIKNSNGNFSAVFQSALGIPGYDLLNPGDRAIAFDYDHSGKQDHLCLYRPGASIFVIYKYNAPKFDIIFGGYGTGISNWGFNDPHDRAIAYDYDKIGKKDHLLFTRAGAMCSGIMKNDNGKFTFIYTQFPQPNLPQYQPYQCSIGGWDLVDYNDDVFPFDLDSTGYSQHLIFYRPGVGRISIIQQTMGGFFSVYQGWGDGVPAGTYKDLAISTAAPYNVFKIYRCDGVGLGGYDFKSTTDHCFAFDFNSTGCSDHVVAYRPGAKKLFIIGRVCKIFCCHSLNSLCNCSIVRVICQRRHFPRLHLRKLKSRVNRHKACGRINNQMLSKGGHKGGLRHPKEGFQLKVGLNRSTEIQHEVNP